jgi:signal transduction histidine kinase
LAAEGWVERLGKLVLTFRALALLVTVVSLRGGQDAPGLAAAILLAAGMSLLPLVAWRRVAGAVLRHPSWLAGEVLLAGVILAATGPDGPFFFFTLGTAVLAGVLFGRLGAIVFGALLVAAFELALLVHVDLRDAAPQARVVLGLPLLYLVAAAAGALGRRAIDAGAAAEAALREAAREAERERERARLARDLHDSLAKSVEGLGLTAATLARRIERDPGAAAALAGQLAADARLAAGEARGLLCELRAGDGLPLAAALEREAEAVRTRAGLAGATHAEPGEDPPPAACRELVLIAREALRNVERHARATRVDVALRREGREVLLEIADDGCGIPAAAASGARGVDGHFGVVGMRERAAQAGGTLELAPGELCGTVVRARVPLAVEAAWSGS